MRCVVHGSGSFITPRYGVGYTHFEGVLTMSLCECGRVVYTHIYHRVYGRSVFAWRSSHFFKKDRDGSCQFLIVESSLHGLVDNVEFHLVHSAYFHLRASGEKG